MATIKQIAANRRNALKSTGPRSERGKAAVRLNALRHGLRAKPANLSEASRNELTRIQREFHQTFQPRNPEQVRLVERMACARWQLMDCQRSEARFLSEPSQADPLAQLRALDAFSKRQARYQRAFTKAFHEYRQSIRADSSPRLNRDHQEAVSQDQERSSTSPAGQVPPEC